MSENLLDEAGLEEFVRRQAEYGPQPGDVYRHYRGGQYEIVTRAIREDTHEDVVIYRKFQKGSPSRLRWERTVADFMAAVEIDGKTGLRFIREQPTVPAPGGPP